MQALGRKVQHCCASPQLRADQSKNSLLQLWDALAFKCLGFLSRGNDPRMPGHPGEGPLRIGRQCMSCFKCTERCLISRDPLWNTLAFRWLGFLSRENSLRMPSST